MLLAFLVCFCWSWPIALEHELRLLLYRGKTSSWCRAAGGGSSIPFSCNTSHTQSPGRALTGVYRVVPLEPEAHKALIAPQNTGGLALHKACWCLARCHGLCVQLSPCSRSRCSTEGGGGGHLLDGLWQEVKFLKQL